MGNNCTLIAEGLNIREMRVYTSFLKIGDK